MLLTITLKLFSHNKNSKIICERKFANVYAWLALSFMIAELKTIHKARFMFQELNHSLNDSSTFVSNHSYPLLISPIRPIYNPPWWPSGLIPHVSNSSRYRWVDPGSNPTRGICVYGKVAIIIYLLNWIYSNDSHTPSWYPINGLLQG